MNEVLEHVLAHADLRGHPLLTGRTPKRAEVLPTCSSYPSATEPSDHTAIWADLELTDATE